MSQKSKRRKLEEEFVFRGLSVSPSTVNEQERSVEAVIATEQPVMEPDFKRYEMVPRTLVMSGMTFPKQIPLLDSHNRRSVKDQLGSIRNLRVENGQLIGRLYFAADAVSEWEKVRDGHVTDVSAGFRVSKEVYVPEGETKSFDGRAFAGPQNVALASRTFEASITPIGADDQAKLRGLDPFEFPQQDEDDDMTTEQRALLLSRGMPEDLEGERAIQWALDNPDKLAQRTEPSNPGQNTNSGGFSAPDVIRELDRLAQEREKAREANRFALRSEIDELCSLADVPVEVSRELGLHDCTEVTTARTKIRDWKVEQSKNTSPALGFRSPRVVAEGRDNFRKDMATCMTDRMFNKNSVSEATRAKLSPVETRGKYNERWKDMPVSEIARECLLADGYSWDDIRHLSRSEIATATFAGPESVGLHKRDGMPYHTTGSFAYLTENAMNKGMRAGYAEARSTWRNVCGIGTPVADFKPKRVYITSAVGNLTAWHDGKEPDKTSFMDARDSYGVEAYAKSLEFSWQLMVNDDMGALIRAPFKMGDAAERTVNTYFWSIITANANLADGVPLFATATGARKKDNYISSGLAVTVASLSALEKLMRLQVGQNDREGNAGVDILNIEPKYLITPAAIKNTAAAVIKSVADPASSNSSVHNPFTNALELICEPLLDANSATAWYLAADPNLVDGIEISFLQGHETPVMWSGMEEKTMTKWWAIRQVFGGKAIDHRGWAKQAGA